MHKSEIFEYFTDEELCVAFHILHEKARETALCDYLYHNDDDDSDSNYHSEFLLIVKEVILYPPEYQSGVMDVLSRYGRSAIFELEFKYKFFEILLDFKGKFYGIISDQDWDDETLAESYQSFVEYPEKFLDDFNVM